MLIFAIQKKKIMKAIFLEYYTKKVVVVPIPKDITDKADAHEFIENCPYYSNDTVSMLVDDDKIQVLKAVFDEEKDEFKISDYTIL